MPDPFLTQKFGFVLSHVQDKTNLSFTASEVFTNYHDTELGFTVLSKPAVELSATVNEKVIPVKNSKLTLNLSSIDKDENVNGRFSVSHAFYNLSIAAHVPLPQKMFDLVSDEAVDARVKLEGEATVRPFRDEDLYLGVQTVYEVPREHEELHYDVRAVVATKNEGFEGGVYGRKGNDREHGDRAKVGVWATSESSDGLLGGAVAEYDLMKEKEPYSGFRFETYVGFPAQKTGRLLAGVQVIPNTTLSLAFLSKINEHTRVSFGYAYVLNFGTHLKEDKHKKSAFSFNIELHH